MTTAEKGTVYLVGAGPGSVSGGRVTPSNRVLRMVQT